MCFSREAVLTTEHNISTRCLIDAEKEESYEVFSNISGWITLDYYIENEMNETLHEVLRKNVVTATRNYQMRVKTLMQTILKNPQFGLIFLSSA